MTIYFVKSINILIVKILSNFFNATVHVSCASIYIQKYLYISKDKLQPAFGESYSLWFGSS